MIIHSIQAFNALPTVNRKRVLYLFGMFFGCSFAIYIMYQLIFTQFKIILLISNIFTNDLLLITSMGISLSIVLYILTKKPQEITISATEETMSVGTWKYAHTDITAFSLVDCLEYIEVVLKTTDVRTPFVYYYIPIVSPSLTSHINALAQMYPYQDTVSELDTFHTILRSLGLK